MQDVDSPRPSASPRSTPLAPALMAAPSSSAMLSLLWTTSIADTVMMNAGRVTLACLLPAGNSVACEDEAATASLEAVLNLFLPVLKECHLRLAQLGARGSL